MDSTGTVYPFFRTEIKQTLLKERDVSAAAVKLASLKPRFTQGEVFRVETSDTPSFAAPSEIGPTRRLQSLKMRDEFTLFLVVRDGQRFHVLARGNWKLNLEFRFEGGGAPSMSAPATEMSMRAWVDKELERKRAEFIAKANPDPTMRQRIKQDALPIEARKAAYRIGKLDRYMATRRAVLEGRLDPQFGKFVQNEVSGGGLQWLGDSAGNSDLVTNTASRASLTDMFFSASARHLTCGARVSVSSLTRLSVATSGTSIPRRTAGSWRSGRAILACYPTTA